eukprot:14466435-Alexandrium_andersonii.AAC.1
MSARLPSNGLPCRVRRLPVDQQRVVACARLRGNAGLLNCPCQLKGHGTGAQHGTGWVAYAR